MSEGHGGTLLRDRDRALLGLLPTMDCPAPVQRLAGDMAASSPASGSSPRMRTTLSSSRQTSCAPARRQDGGFSEALWDAQKGRLQSCLQIFVICVGSCEGLISSSINAHSLFNTQQHFIPAWRNTQCTPRIGLTVAQMLRLVVFVTAQRLPQDRA